MTNIIDSINVTTCGRVFLDSKKSYHRTVDSFSSRPCRSSVFYKFCKEKNINKSNFKKINSNTKDSSGNILYFFVSNKEELGYKELSVSICSGGYKVVNILGEQYRIHRLMMAKTHGVNNIKNLTVNHINGNKLDNRPLNLELCTQSENTKHAWATGLVPASSEEKSAKISKTQIEKRDALECMSPNYGKQKSTIFKFLKRRGFDTKDFVFIKTGKRASRIAVGYVVFANEQKYSEVFGG